MSRPNIVIIMADDAGVGDVESSAVPTPSIDALAEDGISFSQAYSPGSVCTQTRYGLLGGTYHYKTEYRGEGVVFDYTSPLLEEVTTLQEVLQSIGYRTCCAGKWHLGMDWVERGGNDAGEGLFRSGAIDFSAPVGGPSTQGFDRYYGIRASHDMPPYCFIEDGSVVGCPVSEKETYYRQQRTGPESVLWDDQQLGHRITQHALGYISDGATSERPFFLYVPTSAPHRPCLPPSFVEGVSDAGPRGDMVAEFDWTVGRVLNQLEAHGVRDETIVVVTSDHGPRPSEETGHDPTGGLRGQKGTLYEGGVRVPLVVEWAEQRELETGMPVSLIDVFPTIVDVVGASDVGAVDGDSLLDAPRERPLFFEDGGGKLAVRRGEWKYIQGGELYNLADDSVEENNMVDARSDVASSLRSLLPDGEP